MTSDPRVELRDPFGTATTTTIAGDLGLFTPLALPDCDGSYVTFIGAATDPSDYAEIGDLLLEYQGSSYLLTEVAGCSSLRARNDRGESIYAVFFGPFTTFQEACDARAFGPSDAYVKPLDFSSDPSGEFECP